MHSASCSCTSTRQAQQQDGVPFQGGPPLETRAWPAESCRHLAVSQEACPGLDNVCCHARACTPGRWMSSSLAATLHASQRPLCCCKVEVGFVPAKRSADASTPIAALPAARRCRCSICSGPSDLLSKGSGCQAARQHCLCRCPLSKHCCRAAPLWEAVQALLGRMFILPCQHIAGWLRPLDVTAMWSTLHSAFACQGNSLSRAFKSESEGEPAVCNAGSPLIWFAGYFESDRQNDRRDRNRLRLQ